MKSSQDHIPTYRLGDELALDAQGRVLRRPHFLTTREHQDAMRMSATAWVRLITEEKRKTHRLIVESPVTTRPRILCRSRLHWLLKRFIKIE